MMLKKTLIALGVAALTSGCGMIGHGKGGDMHASGAAPAGHAMGHAAHWSYEGEGGPENWAKLEGKFATCESGKEQSPIDIVGAHPMGLQPLEFHYVAMAKPTIINNGHTLQVNYAPGSYAMIGGKKYNLLQFHFHSPAENKVNGVQYDFVTHLVHKSDDGQLAVVGVKAKAGGDNAFLKPILDAAPAVKGEAVASADIDVNTLLPSDKGYYNFKGSLTTPPCSEGVNWNVLKNPVELSAGQLGQFKKIFPMNARPTQPLNGRMIGEL